ncbi:MAG: hypothetical protein A2X77_04855 [Gammaproteobacteria bacterium GWE2_42_36]|nr:MAG: hypothetical protein A2X77_04855 [Gammaproteobacteria bacterium GWE2_42_36]
MSIRKIMITALAVCGVIFALPCAAESTASHESSAKKASVSAQPVNINTADAKALENVNGIGPKRAEDIVAYRSEHGDFKSVDDLSQVKGLGKKRLEKIASQVTVGH